MNMSRFAKIVCCMVLAGTVVTCYANEKAIVSKLENVTKAIIKDKTPKAYYACVARISDGQIVKKITDGEVVKTIGMTSSLKPFVIVSAIENKIVAWDTVIDCKNGRATWGNRRIRDIHAYREISVREVLKTKSNIGTAMIAEKIGLQKLNKTLTAYGLPPLSDEIVYTCLGHETEVSPDQLISAYLKLLKNPEYAKKLPLPLACTWIPKDKTSNRFSSRASNLLIDIKDDYLIIIIAKAPNTFSTSHWIMKAWTETK